jgi:hypothetical protein
LKRRKQKKNNLKNSLKKDRKEKICVCAAAAVISRIENKMEMMKKPCGGQQQTYQFFLFSYI